MARSIPHSSDSRFARVGKRATGVRAILGKRAPLAGSWHRLA
ncbi:MAG: hypothetical protein R3E48_03015 [Burkholderiaceae bacterium]